MYWVHGATSNYVREQILKAIFKKVYNNHTFYESQKKTNTYNIMKCFTFM